MHFSSSQSLICSNAIVITSALSCSNGFGYIASRVLYALAMQGQAPKIFRRTTKAGVPIYAFVVVICIYCLSYMELGENSATVFGWFINLSSVAQRESSLAHDLASI